MKLLQFYLVLMLLFFLSCTDNKTLFEPTNIMVNLSNETCNTKITRNVNLQTPTLFNDEFDSTTLNQKWTIIDPAQDCSFDLSANPGFIRITSPPHHDLFIRTNFNAPRLIQYIRGDFVIETKVTAIMDENDEGAGLSIWKDQFNYIRLDRMSRTVRYPVEQQIIFVGSIAGKWSMYDPQHSNPGNVVHLSNLIDPTYLKIKRSGNIFYGYYSEDGFNWIEIGEIELAIDDPIQIGIEVINEYNPHTFFADFDYFRVQFPSITATIDIHPKTLNMKSKGKYITCYIELPENYSVADIDVESILLNEKVYAQSRPAEIGDYDDDGIADLKIKFKRKEVQSIIDKQSYFTIIITGNLVNGISFRGTDEIKLIY